MFNIDNINQNNKNAKLRSFLEYLKVEQGLVSFRGFNNEVLRDLDEEFFLRAIRHYIDRSGITAKITVENYVTDLTVLFKKLAVEHDIINDVFRDMGRYEAFKEKVALISSTLKNSTPTGTLSLNDYNLLSRKISVFCDSVVVGNQGKALRQLGDYYSNRGRQADDYKDLLSCTATKLVLLSGIKNVKVRRILVEDVDFERASIKVGKRQLDLDDEFKILLTEYKKCRDFILKEKNVDCEYLFITPDGGEVIATNNQLDAQMLFKFYLDTFGNTKIGDLAYRRILDMIRSGIDLYTIFEITGYSTDVCLKLQKEYNESNDMDDKSYLMTGEIQPFAFDNTETKYDYDVMFCPNCNAQVSSSENDWVLLLKDDGIKYLVCRECKGVN